ncbi:hypothetical protein C8R43DRAFT_961298 [Mycena crocata]|nr:hypothetical protein C8R43DRAFT_961298 [Mycena crocata]
MSASGRRHHGLGPGTSSVGPRTAAGTVVFEPERRDAACLSQVMFKPSVTFNDNQSHLVQPIKLCILAYLTHLDRDSLKTSELLPVHCKPSIASFNSESDSTDPRRNQAQQQYHIHRRTTTLWNSTDMHHNFGIRIDRKNDIFKPPVSKGFFSTEAIQYRKQFFFFTQIPICSNVLRTYGIESTSGSLRVGSESTLHFARSAEYERVNPALIQIYSGDFPVSTFSGSPVRRDTFCLVQGVGTNPCRQRTARVAGMNPRRRADSHLDLMCGREPNAECSAGASQAPATGRERCSAARASSRHLTRARQHADSTRFDSGPSGESSGGKPIVWDADRSVQMILPSLVLHPAMADRFWIPECPPDQSISLYERRCEISDYPNARTEMFAQRDGNSPQWLEDFQGCLPSDHTAADALVSIWILQHVLELLVPIVHLCCPFVLQLYVHLATITGKPDRFGIQSPLNLRLSSRVYCSLYFFYLQLDAESIRRIWPIHSCFNHSGRVSAKAEE